MPKKQSTLNRFIFELNNFWTLNREQIRVIAEEFCEIEEDENNRDCDREPVIKEKLRDRIKETNP